MADLRYFPIQAIYDPEKNSYRPIWEFKYSKNVEGLYDPKESFPQNILTHWSYSCILVDVLWDCKKSEIVPCEVLKLHKKANYSKNQFVYVDTKYRELQLKKIVDIIWTKCTSDFKKYKKITPWEIKEYNLQIPPEKLEDMVHIMYYEPTYITSDGGAYDSEYDFYTMAK